MATSRYVNERMCNNVSNWQRLGGSQGWAVSANTNRPLMMTPMDFSNDTGMMEDEEAPTRPPTPDEEAPTPDEKAPTPDEKAPTPTVAVGKNEKRGGEGEAGSGDGVPPCDFAVLYNYFIIVLMLLFFVLAMYIFARSPPTDLHDKLEQYSKKSGPYYG